MSTLRLSAALHIDIPWGFLEATSSFLNFQSSYRLRNAYGVLSAMIFSYSFQAKEYKNAAAVHFYFSHFLCSVLETFDKHFAFSALNFPYPHLRSLIKWDTGSLCFPANLKRAIENGRGSWRFACFLWNRGLRNRSHQKENPLLETKIRRK